MRMLRRVTLGSFLFCICCQLVSITQAADVQLPLERTAYFVGEFIPVAWKKTEQAKLELVSAAGTLLLYQGPAQTVLIDSSRFAPGEYQLKLNGEATGQRVFIVSTLRRSAGSMQDESEPRRPQYPQQPKMTPDERQAFDLVHWNGQAKILQDLRLTAIVPMGKADVLELPYMDVAARSGTLVLPNPDTRPTSFFPVGNHPEELAGMSQRIILGAQANGKYPNFGGFMLGWDTTGYAIGNRRGLMTYWGWGHKTEALRHYLKRIDQHTQDEFRRRTKLEPVTEAEYIAYLLSINRPEFATLIDLPTRHWLNEIAEYTKPMPEQERIAFEERLDQWSAYLMGMYREAYGELSKNLRELDPTLRNSASVQVDHSPVRYGQYFPSAYETLDFQYQSTWNDQVGGPDYAYQWLFTAGLLDMHRNGKPTWLSNAFGPVHGRASTPGKFTRVAAHGLPWGVTGIGFALEGFSNVLTGMNKHANWTEIEGKVGGADVVAGREFLDRFACLAVEGRGDHGVGILFSKSQYQRQHLALGFGTTPYQTFVSLTRQGYTPRFVTEEELLKSGGKIKEPALLIAGQTFPFPAGVVKSLESYSQAGGRIVIDDNSTVAIQDAQKLGYGFSFTRLGKPHNWGAPNTPKGDNDALMFARWHAEVAPSLVKAFGAKGRGLLTSIEGETSSLSLLQVDGGRDAKYVIAVNDSHIQSQADWYQVREKLLPAVGATGVLYDCTSERLLGDVAPFDCDLAQSTARVFAVLPRKVEKLEVRARQKIAAGDPLTLQGRLVDAKGETLAAVIPVCITWQDPSGNAVAELYRSTSRDGLLRFDLPLPGNIAAGKWLVSVRSQLDGTTVKLPIEITAASGETLAIDTSAESLVVRRRDVIEKAFAAKTRFVLPLFESEHEAALLPIAEKVKATLAARGVEVEILRRPQVGTYTLAYQLAPEKAAENALVDKGEVFGKIKRETTNHNDWFSALSGWRFGKPVILLDVTTAKADSPPAETLAAAGLLWPRVTEEYPGTGRAVLEAIPWAFAPRVTTLVLRAHDLASLEAGVAGLKQLPADRLTPAIEAARSQLWRQHHVGTDAAPNAAGELTATGVQTTIAPQPFSPSLAGTQIPTADQVVRQPREEASVIEIPAKFDPKQFTIFVRDDKGFAESATAGMLVPDLRFSDAIQLMVEVKEAGTYRLTVSGTFRYSDRRPCWQAQWEDIIDLREKLVPKQRKAMEIGLQVDGADAAPLVPVVRAEKEVPLELASASAGLKPRTAVEEVVTELAGNLKLSAGRHRLLLIHKNMVDGRVETIEATRAK
ncbi:hypothetical protein ETAA8_44570 [Anatilimnocola aggregata]|uniref:Glycoside hydrolase family 42 N-terminal domain-containing protein n=1 Tax=Anatilimnocola aggregata TaxID=2528021 RepID=A0A517YGK3_9BACT|nr:hypothetical protein [Anatilimnocola aggregata]QDU29348.1 hypothetical protein ETAA8_44570 [Anatilimnocola aggregata]